MTDITIADITNATTLTDGNGVFDKLMATFNLHIDKQYRDQRLTKADYATVYLGGFQAVLQQSMAFVLGEQQASAQVALLEQQLINEQEKADLIIAQTAEAYENITSSEADTVRQNILNNKAVIKLQKDTSLVELQTSELAANGPIERTKLEEEIDILQSQDLEVLDNTTRQNNIATATVSKINDEEALLEQKFISEEAQTVDATGGILKAQQDLTARQTEAFKGKHLNDTLKIQLDAWATAYAITDGDLPSLPKFLTDLNAGADLTSLDTLITEAQDFMDII